MNRTFARVSLCPTAFPVNHSGFIMDYIPIDT